LALDHKYGGKELQIPAERIIQPRAWYDKSNNIWAAFNIEQENQIKGGELGRKAKRKRKTTRPITGIGSNIKLKQALWKMAEEFEKLKS